MNLAPSPDARRISGEMVRLQSVGYRKGGGGFSAMRSLIIGGRRGTLVCGGDSNDD